MQPCRIYRRYVRAHHTTGARLRPALIEATPPQTAGWIRRVARTRAIHLVADDNTAAAFPEVVEAVEAGDSPGGTTMLPGYPRLVPDIEIARRLVDELQADESRAAEVIVVLGSGTLTDLAKFAALEAQLPLISIPTSPSVDAYGSARSALRIEGYHRTPSCRVPELVIACPEVIESAPDSMILAGLGDLVAKLIARIDWEVSAIVTGEPFDRDQADWCARAARAALSALRHRGLREAAFPALDALMVTGLAMQLVGASRPAASSEHTLAHLWEVAVPFAPDAHDLHGILVTSAARIVVPIYRRIIDLVARLDAIGGGAQRGAGVGSVVALDATWSERLPEAMRPFEHKMREESSGPRPDQAEVMRRRDAVVANRERIVELGGVLDEVDRALDALDDAGIRAYEPTVPTEWIDHSLRWVRYLRNRYSLFNLAFEMGWQDDLTG